MSEQLVNCKAGNVPAFIFKKEFETGLAEQIGPSNSDDIMSNLTRQWLKHQWLMAKVDLRSV